MTLGERISKARIDAQLSKSALARCVGVSHTAVALWEADETKSLQADNLFKIASATGVAAHWLQSGQKPETAAQSPHNDIAEPKGAYSRRAPVVGTTQLSSEGYWHAMDSQPGDGDGDGFIPVPSSDPNVYALRIKGDSMAPAIRHGWVVVIEPSSEVHPGEFVLVCTKDDRCMIRELRYERDNEYTFGSINDDLPAITLNKTDITKLHPVAFIAPPSRVKL